MASRYLEVGAAGGEDDLVGPEILPVSTERHVDEGLGAEESVKDREDRSLVTRPPETNLTLHLLPCL